MHNSSISTILSSLKEEYHQSFLKTKFSNLNEILGNGLPCGRIIEIYGPSQIGKSLLSINILSDEACLYFDISRKLCIDYLHDKPYIIPSRRNNDDLFDAIENTCNEDMLYVIDDLPMLGDQFNEDAARFKWLSSRFGRLQRALVQTKSIVIVLNQIRTSTGTGKIYNPHSGCFDPSVVIKMHTAEKKEDYRLVYLDLEKSFFGEEGKRCVLKISKTTVEE